MAAAFPIIQYVNTSTRSTIITFHIHTKITKNEFITFLQFVEVSRQVGAPQENHLICTFLAMMWRINSSARHHAHAAIKRTYPGNAERRQRDVCCRIPACGEM
jgi:hypothetical protein